MHAPPQPPSAKRPPRWGVWIALGCLLPLVAGGSCVAFLVAGYRRQAGEVSAVAVRDVYDIMTGWDEEVFKNRVVDEWSSEVSQESTDHLFSLCKKRLGGLRELRSCQVTREYVGTAGKTVTVRCYATFELDRATIQIVYEREDDEWRIRDFHVDSPAFAAKD